MNNKLLIKEKTREDDSDRKFNDLPINFNDQNIEGVKSDANLIKAENVNDLFDLISKSEIGNNEKFIGAFGTRKGSLYLTLSKSKT